MSLCLDPAQRAALDALAPGECLRIDVADGDSLVAVHAGGAVQVYRNRCPHRGTELDWIPGAFLSPDRRHLQCATHAALFDPHTGRCVSGPCAGERLERVFVPPA